MSYTVLLQPSAADDLEDAVRWIARQSPSGARRWLDGLLRAVETLRESPRRCPLAPENDIFQQEIRHLLYRDYRVIFTLEATEVHVLHIRHSARRSLTPSDVTNQDL